MIVSSSSNSPADFLQAFTSSVVWKVTMATRADGKIINFAYVSYVGTNERDIVPITDIKNFDYRKHHAKTKYKIKWNNNLYQGTIAFFGETEEEVAEKAEKARPKIIPEALLLSNTDNDSDDAQSQQHHRKKKFSQSTLLLDGQRENLQKKLDQLTNKQNMTAKINNADEDDSDTQEENEIIINDDFDENRLLEARKKSCVIDETNRNIDGGLSTHTASEQMVDNKASESGIADSNGNIINQRTHVKNKKCLKMNSDEQGRIITELKLENETLKKKISELEDAVKDFQILNMELQKNVINKISDMEVQLSQLLNRPASVPVQENEKVGFPQVGFVRSSDNAVHIGRDIWLRSETYDSIIFKSTSPSIFVKDMAVAVFGYNVLKQSSVTGKISNRNIKKGNQNPKPKLDPTKLLAIEDIFRHWLKTKKKLNSIEINLHVQKLPVYISKKISQLNFTPKSTKSTTNLGNEDKNSKIPESLIGDAEKSNRIAEALISDTDDETSDTD